MSKRNSRDRPPSEGRRRFVLSGGATVVAGVLPAAVDAAPEPRVEVAQAPTAPPAGYNILLIFTDQERYFEGGYPFPVPGRERLMKRGVSFRRHQHNSNVCTSSRSVVYTGWHMPKTRMFDNIGMPWMPWDLDPGLGTIGTAMTAAGYYAAYKGKWHMTRELNDIVAAAKGKTPFSVDLGLQPTPKLHKVIEQYGFKDYDGVGDMIDLAQGGYMFDPITTGQAVHWLRSTAQQLGRQRSPWFLAVNLVNPHDTMFIDTDQPGGPKVQWKGSIVDGGIGLAPAFPPDNSIYKATWDGVALPASRHQPFNEPGRPPAQLEYQKARAELVGDFPDQDRRWRILQNYYFNCIRDCDMHVVRILDELDRLGLTEKTIVVFTADHGELGGYHQMHGKGSSVYREQMHVPLVIVHPAYPGGTHCDALTCHLDLLPTLVGLTGVAPERRKTAVGERLGRDFSGLLAAPGRAALHAVRDASLYCFGMILYADAAYLAAVQAVRRRTDLDADGKTAAIMKLRPDFAHKRSAIRCIHDGRYKFARYFSLQQHNTPKSLDELTKYNDLELYDSRNDPAEMRNLAADLRANGKLVGEMSDRLNALISAEIGVDDGNYLPFSGYDGWDLQVAVE